MIIYSTEDLYSDDIQEKLEFALSASSMLLRKTFGQESNIINEVYLKLRDVEYKLWDIIDDCIYDEYLEDRVTLPIELNFKHSGLKNDEPSFKISDKFDYKQDFEGKMQHGIELLEDLQASYTNFVEICSKFKIWKNSKVETAMENYQYIMSDSMMKIFDYLKILNTKYSQKKKSLKKQLESNEVFKSGSMFVPGKTMRQSSFWIHDIRQGRKELRNLELKILTIEDNFLDSFVQIRFTISANYSLSKEQVNDKLSHLDYKVESKGNSDSIFYSVHNAKLIYNYISDNFLNPKDQKLKEQLSGFYNKIQHSMSEFQKIKADFELTQEGQFTKKKSILKKQLESTVKVVIRDKSKLEFLFIHETLYFNESSNYMRSALSAMEISRNEIAGMSSKLRETEFQIRYKIWNAIKSLLDYIEFPIFLNLEISDNFNQNFYPEENNEVHWNEFHSGISMSYLNLQKIINELRIAGSTIPILDDILYEFRLVIQEASEELATIIRKRTKKFSTKKQNLKKQLERYNQLYEDSKLMNKNEAYSYVVDLEQKRLYFYETAKFMQFLYNKAGEITGEVTGHWLRQDDLDKFTFDIDNDILSIVTDLKHKLLKSSETSQFAKISIMDNNTVNELVDVNNIVTLVEIFNIKHLASIVTKNGIDPRNVKLKINQSVINLAMLYDYWKLRKPPELNKLRNLIDQKCDEFLDFLNAKILKEVGNYSKKKVNLKKQLESWKLGDNVDFVDKEDLLKQIEWLYNAKMYFYESSKLLRFVFEEANNKYNLDDEHQNLKRQLRNYYTAQIDATVNQNVRDIINKIKRSDRTGFSAMPFGIFMSENKPDVLIALDTLKRVAPIFIQDGRLDRSRIDMYAYQSSVNIGALYDYLRLDRDYDKLEELKVSIRGILGNFESWLMALIEKNGGNFKAKKNRLKSQLETYKPLY